MSPVRILGIAVLVLGVVLLFFGFQQAESPVDQISEAFTGTPTEGTRWYMIAGIIAIVVGGLLALFGVRSTD